MNWYAELDKAIESEPSLSTWFSLSNRSGDWVTCACGQLCSKLPRTPAGEPKDSELFKLGKYFHNWVYAKGWTQARLTLDLIEARTSFLLSQINQL